MDAAASFSPGAESASGNVFLHAFLGAPEKGKFPVVNGARAVGGEMGNRTAFDEPVDDAQGAVFDQVRTVE